jgi:hypothetical protein
MAWHSDLRSGQIDDRMAIQAYEAEIVGNAGN